MSTIRTGDCGAKFKLNFLIVWSKNIVRTHLSKWPSDLKINGTQNDVTFSGPLFIVLPCGVLLFDASVSFKNHEIEAPDWLLRNSSHSDGGF